MRFLLVAALLACAPPVAAEPPAPAEVRFTEQSVGDGAEIRRGWYAVMHYTGWVYDAAAPESKGARFVSSRERGRPATFVYGYGRALQGLEIGMRGMKAGGRRAIVVPPALGYDGFKHPVPKDVPPKSGLVFEVELLDVVPQGNAD